MSGRRRWLVGAAAVGLAGAGAAAGARTAARRRLARPDDDTLRLDLRYDDETVLAGPDGTKIRVVSRGEGPPLVFGHGVVNDVRIWARQLDDLAGRGFRCLAFDQRGHGASTVGAEGFGVDQLAADLRLVLEELDLRGAVVVGHSMGGVGAQALAARLPEVAAERVAGLVLVATTPMALEVWNSLDWWPEHWGPVGDRAFHRVMIDEGSGYLLTRLAFGRRPLPSHVDLTRRLVAECPPTTRIGAPRLFMRLDLRPEIERITLPTLVVAGSRDRITPPVLSRSIAKRIPDSRLDVLPGAGHQLMLERADELNERIAAFAAEVAGA